MKKLKLGLARKTIPLVGSKYLLGGLSPSQGLDCFSLVIDYLQRNDVSIPEEFEGWTMQDYKVLFERDPADAKKVMVELMEYLLDEIPPAFAMAGDVLFAETKTAGPQPFLAIHGGNGSMIGATVERGVIPLPIRACRVLRAFRIKESA